MKELVFVGTALQDLKSFPEDVRKDAGYELYRVQNGLEPRHWKPMKTIGSGVCELRLRGDDGSYRVIYVASIRNVVAVLHAFQKKTQKTERNDLSVATDRLKALKHQS